MTTSWQYSCNGCRAVVPTNVIISITLKLNFWIFLFYYQRVWLGTKVIAGGIEAVLTNLYSCISPGNCVFIVESQELHSYVIYQSDGSYLGINIVDLALCHAILNTGGEILTGGCDLSELIKSCITGIRSFAIIDWTASIITADG